MAGRKSIIGVYCIKNTVNQKVYIGSSTFSVRRRLSLHRSQLKNNRHYNSHLQASYNKHGEAAFEFTILEECTADQCSVLEAMHIKATKSHLYAHGFNKTMLVGKGRARQTEELKAASSRRMKSFHSSRTPKQKTAIKETLLRACTGTISRHEVGNEKPAFSLTSGPRF